MLRTLVISVLATALCSLNAHGGVGDIECEDLDALMNKVSTTHDLSAAEKDRIMGELQRADNLCKEGKTEEADKIMEFGDEKLVQRYLSEKMIEGGH